MLIGVGGDDWRYAARSISSATGAPIDVYGISLGLEYIDVYQNWHNKRGVEDCGCVVVRPDRLVAWRSLKKVPNCKGKLMRALNKILSRIGAVNLCRASTENSNVSVYGLNFLFKR